MKTIQDLSKREKDLLRLIKANCHVASKNYTTHMKRYLAFIGKSGDVYFDVAQIYDKILLAARVIAAIPNAEDVLAVSSKATGQRAVVKFSKFTGSSVSNQAKWTPGALTNYETRQFKEPRLIIVADPHADYKAIKESSYVNVPIVALCDSHHSLKYVDVAIPCNTSSTDSVSLIFWLLAREINVLKGKLNKDDDEWSTDKTAMFDLFLNKDISRFYKVSRVVQKEKVKVEEPVE